MTAKSLVLSLSRPAVERNITAQFPNIWDFTSTRYVILDGLFTGVDVVVRYPDICDLRTWPAAFHEYEAS